MYLLRRIRKSGRQSGGQSAWEGGPRPRTYLLAMGVGAARRSVSDTQKLFTHSTIEEEKNCFSDQGAPHSVSIADFYRGGKKGQGKGLNYLLMF